MDHICINILLNKILIQQDIIRTLKLFFLTEIQYSFVLYTRFFINYLNLFIDILLSSVVVNVSDNVLILDIYTSELRSISIQMRLTDSQLEGFKNSSSDNNKGHHFIQSYIFHDFVNITPNFNFYEIKKNHLYDFNSLNNSNVDDFLKLHNIVESSITENVNISSQFNPKKNSNISNNDIYSFKRYYTHF
jgi:hypothetical protein